MFLQYQLLFLHLKISSEPMGNISMKYFSPYIDHLLESYSDFALVQIHLASPGSVRGRHPRCPTVAWATSHLLCLLSIITTYPNKMRKKLSLASIPVHSGQNTWLSCEISPVLWVGNPPGWTTAQPFLNCCTTSSGFLPASLSLPLKNTVSGELFCCYSCHILHPSLVQHWVYPLTFTPMPLHPHISPNASLCLTG